ncbi:MAG: amidohydrolase [Myxococcales bacterium]|nr:amidohydrolase [Myxococcales bacterium]
MPRIIDADAHVVEGAAVGSQALRRWPDHVQYRNGDDGKHGFYIEGRRYPEFEGPGAGCPPEHALCETGGLDPFAVEGVLAACDLEGIDQMVLFPSLGLAVPGFREPELARGFAQLYNEFIADFCKQSANRLKGVAVVPLEDVKTSIALVRQARRSGLVGVVVPPALETRNLDHPDLDPFYAEVAALDMAIGVHGAPGVHLPKLGVDRFENYVQVHCLSFPFDQMTALTAMVTGGVFERHPTLRVAFLEAGVGWLPFLLDRLHEHWEKRGDWIENGWKRDPAEYLARGQIFLSCEGEEPILPGVIDVLGDDFILYASDFPHWDSDYPNATRAMRERDDVSEASREKILAGNAERLFAL